VPDGKLAADQLILAVDRKITAVRTQSLDLSFNELTDMHADGELIIDPEFQRLFRWSEGAQARFIESLILELPVPPIFLIEREDRVYELIDGLQRVCSYLHFRGKLVIDGVNKGELVLEDCDIVNELNGLTHDVLPRALDIKLKRSYIRAEILRNESDPRLRYYMFKRLNTGGERLSAQEVRNATIRLLSNEFNSFIIDLAKAEDFVACTSNITPGQKSKKYDQELVLRFFAFKNDFDNYEHDVADFMTNYMEEVSDPQSESLFDYNAERATFLATFRVLSLVAEQLGIGNKIFGATQIGGEPTGQFSVYHYEGIVVGLQASLSMIDADNPDHISALAEVVKSGKSDPIFLQHLGAGKNYRNPGRSRVEYFENRFKEALDGCQ
jgi:Protein of unknown function DUF262